MGIDRKWVRELKEGDGPGDGRPPETPASPKPKPKKPYGPPKHLRKVRNFLRRMQDGEDVDKIWLQMDTDLRELKRARRRGVAKTPETQDAAAEIVAMIASDRALARRLGHPDFADLEEAVMGPRSVERDGRWFAYAGSELIGEFATAAEASAAARKRYQEAYGDPLDMRIVKRSGRFLSYGADELIGEFSTKAEAEEALDAWRVATWNALQERVHVALSQGQPPPRLGRIGPGEKDAWNRLNRWSKLIDAISWFYAK